MGCGSSTTAPIENSGVQSPLTGPQKKIVLTTWRKLKGKATEFGVVLFISIFKEIPDVAEYFNAFQNVRTKEDAQDNSLFLLHIKAFLGAVGNAVENMNNPGHFVFIMEELGKEHKARMIDPGHLAAIGGVLLNTLEQFLENDWTDEVKEAWTQIWVFMCSSFERGFQDNSEETTTQEIQE